MNYTNPKKYAVPTRLFALRDPKLSAQVLAAFSGAARSPSLIPPLPAHGRRQR